MKKLFCIALVLFSMQGYSQLLTISWEEKPELHTIKNASFLKESAIVIREDIQMELVPKGKDDIMFMKRIHRIIRVNDEKGIEMYNKIKIGYSKEQPIISVKARTITSTGKVIALSADAFKDLTDEQGNMDKIFAMEGVEKGAEIEYIVFQEQRFSSFGTEYMQDAVPTIENNFELITPSALIFELKSYNQVKVEKDSVFEEKNHVLAHSENLIGLEEEKYASYLPHFARIEYVFTYNLNAKGRGIRIYTWDGIAKTIYTSYSQFTDKEKKAVKKLLEDNKEFAACNGNKEKIAWIENFVKTTFVQQEYVADENASNIDFILKNKVTNESGIKNLFALLFTVQNITYEMGYTISRFTKEFDYNFVNADNLKECMFYFPDTKQYLAPNEPFYRTPFIPPTWCGNQSFFCKTLQLGDIITASAENRKIPEMAPELSYHNHEVSVTFNTAMDTSIIQIANEFKGYNAIDVMPIFVFLEKEKRDEATKDVLRTSQKDEKIDNFKYENNDYKSFMMGKPLRVSATIHATNNIEKAGNKYLFKIGELIGRQEEMYQEKERKFDLEIPNAHQYVRHIKVTIPAGYKVNNVDKLKMNVLANVDGRESCKFVSDYTLTGNILEVNVFEIYHETFTAKKEYDTYKKVINASADFNKIVVVLEKL